MLGHWLTSPAGRSYGFVLLNASNGAAMGMLHAVLPLFALSLSASPAEIGAVRGAAGFGLLLMVLPAGFLVDRYGARGMFHLGNAGVICTSLALYAIDAPSPLIALMWAEGLLRSLKITALNAAFFQALPRLGPSRLGWFKGSLSIGLAFVGPTAAAALLAVSDFVVVFAVAVAAMLLPSLLVFVIEPPPPRTEPLPGLGEALRRQFAAFGELMGNRRVVAALAMEALVAACFMAFMSFITVVAVTLRQIEPAAAALLISVEGLAFIVAIFACGGLVDRIGAGQAGGLALALGAVSMTGLTLAESFTPLAGCSLLLGASLALLNLASTSTGAALPGDKGAVASLFVLAMSLGLGVGPLFAGTIAESLGAQFVFIAFVPLFGVLAACLALRFDGRRLAEEVP